MFIFLSLCLCTHTYIYSTYVHSQQVYTFNYFDHVEILADQFTQVGGDVMFTCTDDFSYDYIWQYNGFTISDEPGHITGANTRTLMITNVTTTDWGTYQCIETQDNIYISITTTAEGILHGKCIYICDPA